MNIGDKVWIYDGMAPPRDGVITALGLPELKGTWYARDQFGERLYGKPSLFTDSEKLLGAVQDTIDLLERWEREFQEQPTTP